MLLTLETIDYSCEQVTAVTHSIRAGQDILLEATHYLPTDKYRPDHVSASLFLTNVPKVSTKRLSGTVSLRLGDTVVFISEDTADQLRQALTELLTDPF